MENGYSYLDSHLSYDHCFINDLWKSFRPDNTSSSEDIRDHGDRGSNNGVLVSTFASAIISELVEELKNTFQYAMISVQLRNDQNRRHERLSLRTLPVRL